MLEFYLGLSICFPDTTHGTAIGLPIRPGLVWGVNVDIYGSLMECLGILQDP